MNLGIETEVLEFKKSTSELKEACVSISAILNKHGVGTLYFGVKNNGDVVGQAVSENTLRDEVHEFITTTRSHYYRHYYRNLKRRPALPEKLQQNSRSGSRKSSVK